MTAISTVIPAAVVLIAALLLALLILFRLSTKLRNLPGIKKDAIEPRKPQLELDPVRSRTHPPTDEEVVRDRLKLRHLLSSWDLYLALVLYVVLTSGMFIPRPFRGSGTLLYLLFMVVVALVLVFMLRSERK